MEKIPYGNTGHKSSRILFGAAAIGGMRQEKADSVLQLVLESGINHIDVAASYGEAEVRLAPFLKDHRDEFFLATKTGDRTYDGAKSSIERSLERMGVDQIDVIQFHNLAKDDDWNTVMGRDGALKAAVEARDQGLVRYIGVTGHGTRIAEMHLKSLAAFEFASVLLPYNHTSMLDKQYAEEFEALYTACQEQGANPINRATSWEADIINWFRSNADEKELIGERDTPTGHMLYMSRPIQIKNPNCLACHSTPSAAPQTLIDTYGTANGFGWQMNEVVGAQIVSIPMSLPLQRADSTFYTFLGLITGGFVITIALLNLLLHFIVIKPILTISKQADAVSMGNLEVEELNVKGKDEIASVGQSFNRMHRSLVNAFNMLDSEDDEENS